MEDSDGRLKALLQWRHAMIQEGHYAVPSLSELRAIAAAPHDRPPELDSVVVTSWRPAIEWVLHQVRVGSRDPVGNLPAYLRPAAAPPGESSGEGAHRPRESTRDPAESASLESLRAWRTSGLTRDPRAFEGIRDATLQQLVRSGKRTLAEVSNAVPATIRPYAKEIVDILQRGASAATRPASPTPAETPTVAPQQPDVGAQPPRETAPAPAAPPPPPHRPDRPPAAPAQRGDTPPPPPTRSEAARPVEPRREGTAAEPTGAPTQTGAPGMQIDPHGFAPLDFSEAPGEPQGLRSSLVPAGITLSWPPPAPQAPVTIYRVVSSDDHRPYAPERADLIAVTDATTAVDVRPFTTAVRYLQVWRNEGATLQEAQASQPRLHAEGSIVSPVRDFVIREDEGRVIGQWHVFPEVRRVQVHRIPIEKAAQVAAAGPPEFQINVTDDNLGGFVDSTAERGRRYLYQARAEVEVDDLVRLSVPQSQEVTVSAVLAAVTDLDVRLHGSDEDPHFDITWTPPAAGRVAIFRTRTGPQAGADAGPRPESVLPQMHLAPSDQLSYPITRQPDGRVGMRDVPWPADWTRTYFTPVTLLDGMARVGRTTTATRIPPVREPRLVERMNKQVVTFGWPTGAASVVVHVGPAGQDATSARGGRSYEVSAGQYRDLGGLHLPEPLPAAGCSLHLVPVAFARGERVEGDPVTLSYEGLLRLSYRIAVRRGVLGRPSVLTVALTSEVPVPHAPPFVLVYNPERLPLDVQDGDAVPVRREGDDTLTTVRRFVPNRLGPGSEPSVWRAELKERSGFVRVMADLPAGALSRVALLDPPIRQLMLGARG